jgi:PemK-like, MazF-like toxin of type II toxin-antitoxin system
MSTSDQYGEPAPERGGAYTYTGPIQWEYSPELDRDADPGEIVWTWVAFEENAHAGKDRPIAVVGRADDGRLAALMLSSREHDGDRDWISIGTGPWDREGRESWVRRDRVLAVHADAVRREGAVLPRPTYDAIVDGMGGHARATSQRSASKATPGGPSAPKAARPGILGRLRRMLTST